MRARRDPGRRYSDWTRKPVETIIRSGIRLPVTAHTAIVIVGNPGKVCAGNNQTPENYLNNTRVRADGYGDGRGIIGIEHHYYYRSSERGFFFFFSGLRLERKLAGQNV